MHLIQENIDLSNRTKQLVLALIFGLTGFLTPVNAAGELAGSQKTILFVCQFGSVKSALAREIFRKKVADRGLNFNVISRAITPEDHAAPGFLTQVASEGINLAADPLRKLDTPLLESADIVVIFDSLPAGLIRADARDWRQVPSMNDDYLRARPDMDARLDQLLVELETRP
jgi:protein-tyrosine-phosphatase